MRRALIAEQLEIALRATLDVPALRLVGLDGARPAADEEREPWIAVKYGPAGPDDWFGVVPARALFERRPGSGREVLDLIVKINPRQGLARGLIPWIVERAGIALDRPYWDYRCTAEVDRTGEREFHIYELAAAGNAALARVLPRYYGAGTDPAAGERVLFLEAVRDIGRLDAAGAEADWPPDAIGEAIAAMAAWQASFWGAGAGALAWAGPRSTCADRLADEPLWRALLDDAAKRFPAIVTPEIARRRHRLIDSLGDWYVAKEAMPTTLAHNDFNERNVGFRPQVVVLDWELAQCNSAHRDLVELLTFVLPPSATRAEIDALVERHRRHLVSLGVREGLDPDHWMEAFRAELRVEAIDRIAMQGIFAAAFPLAYFARINATSERLLDLYD